MNRFVLPVVFTADVIALIGFWLTHVHVLRVFAWSGLALVAVLMLVDMVLERRPS